MSVTQAVGTTDKKIRAEFQRKIALNELRHLESTLITSLADGQALLDACNRLRVAKRPAGSSKSRPIQEVFNVIDPTFMFSTDDASNFAGRRGRLNRRKLRESASCFAFEGVVTLTRVMERGAVHFSIMDGQRSLLVGPKVLADSKSCLVVVRRGSFRPPSGRSAMSGRHAGRGPSGSSE